MTKPKLTYFDAPASRGEECRLALHAAGVDFEDNRIKPAAWSALKPSTPFGSLPIYEEAGKPPLAQSNAILVYLGRKHGLHPTDLFEAAQHEALLSACEELRHEVVPTLRMQGDEKQAAREKLAAGYLPEWGARVEKHLASADPFVAGGKLNVVDIKLYMIVRWFAKGTVDHVPATVFASFPRLVRLYEAVAAHPAVVSWYAR